MILLGCGTAYGGTSQSVGYGVDERMESVAVSIGVSGNGSIKGSVWRFVFGSVDSPICAPVQRMKSSVRLSVSRGLWDG
jgi:hypothetical protein